MASMKERVTILVDDDLAQRLDDFRFTRRYNSQSDAVRELLYAGLAVLEGELDAGEGAEDGE